MSARAVQKGTIAGLGEFGLIRRIQQQVGGTFHGIRGIGDDAAVIPLSSKKVLLLTADMLVEGVHFTRSMPARGIGYKAMAASISDIAAMGGLPKHAIVSLGAPPSTPAAFVTGLYAGMNRAANAFGVGIAGGDTVRAGRIVINVAMTGEAVKREVVLRSGTRAGDQIFVTGALGRSFQSGRHLRFTPRVKESRYLVRHFKPTAMIDISDGLAADLGHVLSESRVGAVIDEDAVPKRRNATIKHALFDGEDFELLFTLRPSAACRLEQHRGKCRFTRIGEIIAGKGLRIRDRNGCLKRSVPKGYTHF